MPTYEYRCPDGHEFERFYRKISDAASELPCPECGKTATRQLSGGAGLVFKGSGFYLTDYGKNAHRKGGPAKPGGDSGGEAPGESAGSTGGESKGSETKSSDAKASDSSAPASSAGSTEAKKPASSPSQTKGTASDK